MSNTAKKQMPTKSMTMKTAVQHLAMNHAGLAQGIAGFDSFNATTPNVQRNSAHFCQWAVQGFLRAAGRQYLVKVPLKMQRWLKKVSVHGAKM